MMTRIKIKCSYPSILVKLSISVLMLSVLLCFNVYTLNKIADSGVALYITANATYRDDQGTRGRNKVFNITTTEID